MSTEFDRQLLVILNTHFKGDAIRAIKQAVDKYVIGENSTNPQFEGMIENAKLAEQRQSLWGDK